MRKPLLGMFKSLRKPVVLLVLDGWGIRKNKKNNAIRNSKTPNLKWLYTHSGHSQLFASGEAVGLPKGFQGNSEVGHITLGAGRVVPQMLKQINDTIQDHSFFSNTAFLTAIKNCKKYGTALHLMGLIQDQGVHAHQDHLIALLHLAKKNNVTNVWVHVFTDGRDTLPISAMKYFGIVDLVMKKLKIGTWGVIIGRYYAMDRDRRWDRTKLAYDAIISGKGKLCLTYQQALSDAYQHHETDEFIQPRLVNGYNGIKPHDSIIFFNYRLDRARQLTQAITELHFSQFPVRRIPLCMVSMTPYYANMRALVAYPILPQQNLLGKVLSKSGLSQLRTAETEKYAHVTYFFNGENETPYLHEDRVLIPSPKIATYDLKPEMSVYSVTNIILKDLKTKGHDIIIANFANGDMVGHTGKFKCTTEAVHHVDTCIGKIREAIEQVGGILLITGDHGNCEDMGPHWKTSHTLNKVPLIIYDVHQRRKIKDGCLSDVAPTILFLLGISKPQEMSGKNLISR